MSSQKSRLPFRSSIDYNDDSHPNAQLVRQSQHIHHLPSLQVPVPLNVRPASGLPLDTKNDRVEAIDLTHQLASKKKPIRQPISPTSFSGFIKGQISVKPSVGTKEILEWRNQATGSKGQSSPQVQDYAFGELQRRTTLRPPVTYSKAQDTCCEPLLKCPSIAQPATLEARRGVNAQLQNKVRRGYLAGTQRPSEADSRPLDSSEVAPTSSSSLLEMAQAPVSYRVQLRPHKLGCDNEMAPWTTLHSKTQSTTPEYPPLIDIYQAAAVRADEAYLSTAPKPSDLVPSSALATSSKPTPGISGTTVTSDITKQSAASAAKAARLFLHLDPANAGKLVPAATTISKWLLEGASFEVLYHVLETKGFVIDRAGLKPLLFAVCPELRDGSIGQAAAGTTMPPCGALSTANCAHDFQPQRPVNGFDQCTGPAMRSSNKPRKVKDSIDKVNRYLAQLPDALAGLQHLEAEDVTNNLYLAQIPDVFPGTQHFDTDDGTNNLDDDEFCIVGDPAEDDMDWAFVYHNDTI